MRSTMKGLALLFSIVVLTSGICVAQTSAFTYQGKLADAGAPATASTGAYTTLVPLWRR